MLRSLTTVRKFFLVCSLYILMGENYLFCRVVPVIDRNPQKTVSNRPEEWKHNDTLSKEIRSFHRDTRNWYGEKQAVLSCQRDILFKYDEKASLVLKERTDWMNEVFTKFKNLEQAKNRTLIACARAFQVRPGSRVKIRGQEARWKYNDDLSQDIRQYDRMKNKWINEDRAVASCRKQAETNYESSRLRYYHQNDVEGLQDIENLKERSIKACRKAFERAKKL